ncbi:conserved protein (OrfY) involved in tetrahydromethanopterin-dependent formaldehyde oxidation [Methylocella tundrae]|uniref:Conserved protein (OrfY) involved in tetrahydromethanopterin-dependent formaldehyde oxidation n=1 Tax=Methylocella tundrae TaxID=227605 RepID=A0A8B6M1L7_METTU|nr:ATP-grasp domain-containing protein [Methylocella tundrae]VTZ48140.1 conserved protein (OrfY) involved in tetrahydromethanopterin-dependent formaldehyde oxidation [Methylocella tundrae]
MSEAETLKDGPAILIAAAAGRALAAAARRAGYRPLVADLFDDEDTRALCVANCLVGDPQTGFDGEALIAALNALADGCAPIGIVYGAGFEDRVELLDELAERWTLFGNRPETVRRAKNPAALAQLCRSLGVPHPDISLTPPANAEGWLVKSVGAAGGSHVAPAGALRAQGEDIYFQRVAPGEPVSILGLGDGAGMMALGASRQWAAPTGDEPFRFGGCARPAALPPDVETRLNDAASSLSVELGLSGLNSFDFLLDGDAFVLIEINPRPGATLDIFEDRHGLIFAAHIDASLGRLPALPLEFPRAAAAGIAYARRRIAAMPALDWPEWAADRQKPKSALGLNDPLCTIKANAADPSRARELVKERTASILDGIDHIETEATS